MIWDENPVYPSTISHDNIVENLLSLIRTRRTSLRPRHWYLADNPHTKKPFDDSGVMYAPRSNRGQRGLGIVEVGGLTVVEAGAIAETEIQCAGTLTDFFLLFCA